MAPEFGHLTVKLLNFTGDMRMTCLNNSASFSPQSRDPPPPTKQEQFLKIPIWKYVFGTRYSN